MIQPSKASFRNHTKKHDQKSRRTNTIKKIAKLEEASLQSSEKENILYLGLYEHCEANILAAHKNDDRENLDKPRKRLHMIR